MKNSLKSDNIVIDIMDERGKILSKKNKEVSAASVKDQTDNKAEQVVKVQKVVEEPKKLYIDEKWYIPLNDQGYCIGLCYEGALGIVVQLRNNNGGVYALKIPRLLADTLKENSYICELLNEEEKSVTEIFTTQDEIGRDGLLRGGLLKDKIIQAPIQSKNSDHEEARLQDGQIIAVQFNKGKMPRFCGLKKEKDGELSIFPKGINLDELPINNMDDFNQLKENASKNDSPWKKTIVLYEPTSNRQKVDYVDIIEFLKEDGPIEKLWYVGLPSIVYEWGNSTLAEVIANNKTDKWALGEYIELTKSLLGGLNSLHHRNVIHSDIRPANVMHIGTGDNPRNYKLIDYGSFNKHDYGINSANKAVSSKEHKSILGPTLSKERTSPFYAPERRADIEKENADTAVFMLDKDNVRIMLGWRHELLDGEHVQDKIITEIRNYTFPHMKGEEEEGHDPALLIPGDKIQIREYIFQIEDIAIDENGNKIILASKNYWKIFHGKIITSVSDEILDNSWMSIPRTKELRQWSFATDIYGIGSIFFYLLFWGGVDKGNEKLAEIEFSEMLAELDSVPFFKNMWVDLAPLCCQLEEFYEKDITKDDIETFMFNPEDYLDFAKESDKQDIQKKSFLEYAKYITFLITYSVKGTRKILKLLDYNYIYFIYAIHFGLCSLHRRVSLFNDEYNNEIMTEETMVKNKKDIVYPFCKSRINNRVDKNDAVTKAHDYLEMFTKLLNSKKFDQFTLSENERERNNPQHIPATELRRRFVELNDKYNLLEGKLGKVNLAKTELESLSQNLSESLKAEKDNKSLLEGQNKKLNLLLQEKTNNLKTLEKEYKKIKDKLESLEKSHTVEKQKSSIDNEQFLNVLKDNKEIKVKIYNTMSTAKKKIGLGYSDEVFDAVLLTINELRTDKK